MQLGWTQIVMAIIYMILIVGVGLFMSRKVKSSDDFWVGGRSVGPVTTALSYGASYISTVAIIGGPPMYYLYGLGYASFEIFMSVLLTCVVIFFAFAPKMRALSERLNVVSMSGFMAVRYRSNKLRLLCASLIAIMMIPYAISATKGIAEALYAVAGVPYTTGVIILAVVAFFYLVTSGYWGVATTDLIQGITIAVGVLAVAITVLHATGGIAPMMDYINSDFPQHMTMTGNLSWGALFSYAGVWALIAFGQPQLITKFMGLKDSRTIGTVIRVSIIWMITFMLSISVIGIGALYLFKGRTFENIDLITATVVADYSGTFISGLFLCGVIAAGLSTLVALILTSSAAVAKDIYEDYRTASTGKAVDSAKSLKVSRIVTGVVLVIVVIGSIYPPDFVWQLSTMSAGVMGAAFTAPMLLGLYWKRATTQGCFAAVIGGSLVSIVWYLAGLTSIVHSFVPGTVVSFILLVVVSLLTKPMPQEHVDVFFEAGCSKEKIDAAIASAK